MNLFVVNVDGTGLVQLNPPEIADWLGRPQRRLGLGSRQPAGRLRGVRRGLLVCGSKAVFVVNADGSNPVRITEWASGVLTVQWSPDSQLLAITTAGPTGSQEIVTFAPTAAT